MAKLSREEFIKLLTRVEQHSNTDFFSPAKKSSLQTKSENTIFYIFVYIIKIQFPCHSLSWDILQDKGL